MGSERVSALLVVADAEILGILTERDLLRAWRGGLGPADSVDRLMSCPVRRIAGGTGFRAAYRQVAEAGFRHIVVTGEGGRALGIVSETDYLHHLGARHFQRERAFGKSFHFGVGKHGGIAFL